MRKFQEGWAALSRNSQNWAVALIAAAGGAGLFGGGQILLTADRPKACLTTECNALSARISSEYKRLYDLVSDNKAELKIVSDEIKAELKTLSNEVRALSEDLTRMKTQMKFMETYGYPSPLRQHTNQ